MPKGPKPEGMPAPFTAMKRKLVEQGLLNTDGTVTPKGDAYVTALIQELKSR